MRICLVGPVYPYRGGIAHHTAMLASALEKHNHFVHTISFKRQYPAWLYPGKSDKDPSEHPIRTQAAFILDPFIPWTWEQAVREIQKSQPTLVVTQWWTTFWALPFFYLNAMLRKSGIKTVFLIHNVMPHEQRFWDRWLSKLALMQANEYIVQTQAESDRLKKMFPKASIHLCYIPPYFDLNSRTLSKEDARKDLGLPLDEKIFLFFGIVRPYKGLLFLLDAFKAMLLDKPNSRLLIAGEFWQDKSIYLDRIEQLNLTDRISIIDQYLPNEKVPVIFAAADCLVAPYTAGTQSAVVSTGLAFGLPMIITEQIAAGVSEENLRSIKVIAPQDIEGLAKAMAEIEITREKQPPETCTGENDWVLMAKTIEEIESS